MKPNVQLEFVEQGREQWDALVSGLRGCFADTFVLYLKAHGYHWNVEGPNFHQYHDLFGDVASELYGTIDKMAETIRTIQAYTPYTLDLLGKFRSLPDAKLASSAPLPMVKDLLDSNALLLERLTIVYAVAEKMNNLAVANYLQDRIEAHKKHEWFLTATLK